MRLIWVRIIRSSLSWWFYSRRCWEVVGPLLLVSFHRLQRQRRRRMLLSDHHSFSRHVEQTNSGITGLPQKSSRKKFCQNKHLSVTWSKTGRWKWDGVGDHLDLLEERVQGKTEFIRRKRSSNSWCQWWIQEDFYCLVQSQNSQTLCCR